MKQAGRGFRHLGREGEGRRVGKEGHQTAVQLCESGPARGEAPGQ